MRQWMQDTGTRGAAPRSRLRHAGRCEVLFVERRRPTVFRPCLYLSVPHIRVIVNEPFPVHPAPPVKDQVPEMAFPVAVPVNVSVLPAGDPDRTMKLNWPDTLPLKSPVNVKEPLSVSPDTKHGESLLN